MRGSLLFRMHDKYLLQNIFLCLECYLLKIHNNTTAIYFLFVLIIVPKIINESLGPIFNFEFLSLYDIMEIKASNVHNHVNKIRAIVISGSIYVYSSMTNNLYTYLVNEYNS